MISKLGAGLVSGILTGSDLGSVRARELSPEQRSALINYYGLDEDANLERRNMWRGALSRLGTSALGTGALYFGGKEALKNWKDVQSGKAPAKSLLNRKTVAGAGLLAASGLLRDYLERKATDKYGAGNARKVMAEI